MLGRFTYLAATLLMVSMVGGVAVADKQIGSRQIEEDAVRSRHINDGAVKLNDLSNGVQGKLEEGGPKGDQGEPGEDGEDGERGPRGDDGVSGYGTVGPPSHETLCEGRFNGAAHTNCRVTEVGFHDITVNCPVGKVALGGGIETLNENESPKVTLHGTHPAAIDNASPWHAHAWEAEFTIAEAGPTVQAFVVCATVTAE